jgi:hypothetical protein
MKFLIKSKQKEEMEGLLERFTTESQTEYERQVGQIKINKIKSIMPEFITGYYFDEKENGFILWNTFQIPKIPKILGFMNPFKKAVEKMEDNLKGFLRDNGIKDAEIKLIER